MLSEVVKPSTFRKELRSWRAENRNFRALVSQVGTESRWELDHTEFANVVVNHIDLVISEEM